MKITKNTLKRLIREELAGMDSNALMQAREIIANMEAKYPIIMSTLQFDEDALEREVAQTYEGVLGGGSRSAMADVERSFWSIVERIL
jgi:hypothetical protein